MERADRIASFLLKSLRRANRAYDLIAPGDRIAVGVSGGKDSQTLLRLLARWGPAAPFRFELLPVHVALHPALPEAPDRQAELATLFDELGLDGVFRPLVLPPDEPAPPGCFRCSWLRRKTLFTAAHELGCNKVALGHHADDVAQTTLLNLFFHGRLESMPPRSELFDGLLTLIRPLTWIEERDIVTYARAAGFYQPAADCPRDRGSKRAQVKALLRDIQKVAPRAKVNLYRAVERASGWGSIPVTPP